MSRESLRLDGWTRTAFLGGSAAIAVIALAISVMTFRADRHAGRAYGILDDPLTDQLDIVDLSGESLSSYGDAIELLKRASRLAPLTAAYERDAGVLLFRRALWTDTMLRLGAAVPEPAMQSAEDRREALRHMRAAIHRDPADSTLRLQYGQMLADNGAADAAAVQLARAVELVPVNAEVRYAVAANFLIMRRADDAAEQARILARIDDSYRLDDDDPRTGVMREQRTHGYEQRLVSSYLYKALEIIWRSTGRDEQAVRSAVPDNADAREACRLFFEQKGVR